jgi:hypothetical protein
LEEEVNIKLTKKVAWVLYVIVFCIAPYLLRLLLSFVWSDELEGFFISEMDLFCFCIAVTVALFAEIRNLKKVPFNLGKEVFHGLLMLYIISLFVGIFFSLEFEHRITVLRTQCYELPKMVSDTDNMLKSLNNLESKKLVLFLGSILAAIMTTVLSYKTLFKRNG